MGDVGDGAIVGADRARRGEGQVRRSLGDEAVGLDGRSNFWDVAWFDDGADMTYSVAAGNTAAGADSTDFPNGKSPGHVKGAQHLADLAGELVLWVPEGTTGATQPQQPSAASSGTPQSGAVPATQAPNAAQETRAGPNTAEKIVCPGIVLLVQGIFTVSCNDGTGYSLDTDHASVSSFDPSNPSVDPTVGWAATTEDHGLSWNWVDSARGRTCEVILTTPESAACTPAADSR
jgi:hypothetical protein